MDSDDLVVSFFENNKVMRVRRRKDICMGKIIV